MSFNFPGFLSGLGYPESDDVTLAGDVARRYPRVKAVSCTCQIISLVLVLLLVVSPIHAQDTGPDLVRVSTSVYALVDPVAGANSAVIVTETELIVVDAQLSPTLARSLSERLSDFGLPVRYLINTHWHVDHSHGNSTFRELYPEVEIVSHPSSVDAVLEQGPRQYGLWPNFLSQQQIDSPLLPDVMRDLEDYQPHPATMTFTGDMRIRRGDVEVLVAFPGRGHTNGDLVVFVPSDSVLISGDLLLGFAAHPLDYGETLRRVLQLDFATVVPGHGPVDRSPRDRIVAMSEESDSLVAMVRQLLDSGVPSEEIPDSIEMSSWPGHVQNRERFIGAVVDELRTR